MIKDVKKRAFLNIRNVSLLLCFKRSDREFQLKYSRACFKENNMHISSVKFLNDLILPPKICLSMQISE